jgi:hypothetical protein
LKRFGAQKMLAGWEEHGTKSHELEVAQAREMEREFTSAVYKKEV